MLYKNFFNIKFKKLRNACLISFVSLIADIITITPIFKKFFSIFNINVTITNIINWGIFALALISIILCVRYIRQQLNKYLKDIGTHGIPCELVPFYYYKIKNKNTTILKLIHRDLYHEMYKINRSLHTSNEAITLNDIKTSIESLLKSFYMILNCLFRLDLTIRVYRITETDGNYELRETTLIRSNNNVNSEQEQCYIVYKNCSTNNLNLETYTQLAINYNRQNGCGRYLKNSVFDYILSSNHNSWISNDISIDQQKNQFFSSSPNLNNYKSFAAFAILPPDINENREISIKGIISFESPKTGIFSEQECVYIMGLMAHLLNDIFENID